MPLSDALARLPGSTLVTVTLPRKRDSITLGRGSYQARIRLADLARLVSQFGDSGLHLRIRVA